MDSESGRRFLTLSEALRATIPQTLIGCPDWCSWGVTVDRHQHLVVDGCELVVSGVIEEVGAEEVLEVRHLAAPPQP